MNKTVLLPPCSYQGGKQRVAKEIVDYIYKTTPIYPDTIFYDLCCGSGVITLELINRGVKPEQIIMLDISSWGEFWKRIGEGTFDIQQFYKYSKAVPRDKSLVQDFMKALSKTNADEDECYKYILLQASAFGGKQIWNENGVWKNTTFRNYWKPTETSNRRSPVNPIMPMIDEIETRVSKLISACKGITCYKTNIYEILNKIVEENTVIYIDPPYKNVTKYGFDFVLQEFLSKLFDKTMSPIFVSERECLSDEAVKLNFSGKKGGISGDKGHSNEEWLNVYR